MLINKSTKYTNYIGNNKPRRIGNISQTTEKQKNSPIN